MKSIHKNHQKTETIISLALQINLLRTQEPNWDFEFKKQENQALYNRLIGSLKRMTP
jgi:hypothetical protein